MSKFLFAYIVHSYKNSYLQAPQQFFAETKKLNGRVTTPHNDSKYVMPTCTSK